MELYDKLIDMIADAHAIHDLYVSMADITSDRAISWTRLRSTLIFLEDTLTPEDNAILHIDVETIKQLLRRLADPEQWPFLQQDFVDHSRDADLATLEDHCHQVRRHLAQGALTVVPRPLGRHRVILHLYSGRRRRGDVQYYLDQLSSNQTQFHLHIVSLDIVIDKIYGDAMRSDTCDFWLKTPSGVATSLQCLPGLRANPVENQGSPIAWHVRVHWFGAAMRTAHHTRYSALMGAGLRHHP